MKPKKFFTLEEKSAIVSAYQQEELSQVDLVKRFGGSTTSIKSVLVAAGVEIRPQSFAMKGRSQPPEVIAKRQITRLANHIPLPEDKQRRHQLMKKYGLTLEAYQRMFQDQNGRCALCLTHQDDLPQRFSVDHNHDTGQVRGLLCARCNWVILPRVEKNLDEVRRAIDYLGVKI